MGIKLANRQKSEGYRFDDLQTGDVFLSDGLGYSPLMKIEVYDKENNPITKVITLATGQEIDNEFNESTIVDKIFQNNTLFQIERK